MGFSPELIRDSTQEAVTAPPAATIIGPSAVMTLLRIMSSVSAIVTAPGALVSASRLVTAVVSVMGPLDRTARWSPTSVATSAPEDCTVTSA